MLAHPLLSCGALSSNPVERALSEYAYFIDDPTAMSPEGFTALCSTQVATSSGSQTNLLRETRGLR